MRNLLYLLWNDRTGSTLSSEMALVTSVTVGALFMGMAEFSATVNREFENAAAETGLMTVDEAVQKKKQKEEAEKDEEEKKKKAVGWRFRRAEDREEETLDEEQQTASR